MGCTGSNQAVEDSKASAVEFAISLGLSKKNVKYYVKKEWKR